MTDEALAKIAWQAWNGLDGIEAEVIWRDSPSTQQRWTIIARAVRAALLESLAQDAKDAAEGWWRSGGEEHFTDPYKTPLSPEAAEIVAHDPLIAQPDDEYYTTHMGYAVAYWLRSKATADTPCAEEES